MKQYFITGAGTNVGKTLITSALAAQLIARGEQVHALKPVISGFAMEEAVGSDSGLLLRAQGLPVTEKTIETISPWRFTAPLSPDMAAEEERREVDPAALVAFCKRSRSGITLVEGAGGVMSPVTRSHTVLDWMAALAWPVIVVGGTYLGSISHTLTACAAVQARGLQVNSVILSESESPQVGLERTMQSLRRFLPAQTPLTGIARQSIEGLDSLPHLWESMPDITGCIV